MKLPVEPGGRRSREPHWRPPAPAPNATDCETGNDRRAPRRIGLLYAAPALAFVAFFVLYPMLDLIRMSLTSASLLGGGEFIGLRNYVKAAGDATFWHALAFTSRIYALHHARF